MFKLLKRNNNLSIINSVPNLEQYVLKQKKCYVGFDLDFLLYTLPKLKNWYKLFSNHSLVLTAETLEYIFTNKDSKDLFNRYGYNFITEISEAYPFSIIPETQNTAVFQEFMVIHNLNLSNMNDRSMTYFKFFENQLASPETFLLLISNESSKVIAEQLCMKNIIFFPNDKS